MNQETKNTEGVSVKEDFRFTEYDKESMEGTKNTIPSMALSRILAERHRQFIKWGEQNHGMFVWLAILHEETGELAEACLHKRFGGPKAGNVQLEADHVAAVGLQIVDYLVRQQNKWEPTKEFKREPVNDCSINQAAVAETKEEFLKQSLEKSRNFNLELSGRLSKVSARRDKWKAKALELEAAQCEKVEQKERFLDELFDCVSHLKKYRNGQYVFLNGESWIHCKAQKVAQALVNLSLL